MRQFKLWTGVGILLGIDMISKYIFYTLKYMQDSILIRPVLNTGISRSLPLPFILILWVSILGIGAFIRLFVKNKIGLVVTTLLIAGTAGNLIDRLVYGGVRDFINIGIFNFPIFNLADTMLSIWVIIRIIIVMLEKKK